jgi:hypothetical protein
MFMRPVITGAITSRSREVEFEALLQPGKSRRIVTPGAIPLDPELHGIEQIMIAEGLRGTRSHRP